MGDNACLSRTCRAHIDHFAFARTGDFFNNCPRIIIVHVNCDLFDGFKAHAIIIFAK